MDHTFTLKLKRARPKVVSLFTLLLSLLALQSLGQNEIVFSQNFVEGQAPSEQCTAWSEFASKLTPEKNYKSVLFRGSRDEEGLLLTDGEAVATIASAIHNGTTFSIESQGQTWAGNEISGYYFIATTNTFTNTGCVVTDYAVRPCISNDAWGGINGSSCNAESQRIDVIFALNEIEVVENIPATCHESSDGSLTVTITSGVAPYTFEWSNGETTTSNQPVENYSLVGNFEDKAYYTRNTAIGSFDDASSEAQSHYGYLCSINSAEENAAVASMITPDGQWIGLTDRDEEGTFVWDSGEPLTYTNWDSGEPNNSNDEDYVHIRAGGVWNDNDWVTNNVPIIELPAISTIDNLAPGDYTVTVTDAEGSVFSNTFTVGPDPIEISFDMTQTSTCEETGDGAATANVTGGTAPFTYAWDSGEDTQSISNKAFGSYEVTVTDNNGCNPAVASVEITTDDNTAPIAQVQDIEVHLDANGAASIVADDIDNGSSDDCALANISIDVSTFDCDDVSSSPTVTLTVTDAEGNSSQNQAEVTVNDTISPIASARTRTIELDEDGNAVAIADDFNDGSSDNCGIDGFVLSKTVYNCNDLGSNDVVLTVSDIHGNSKSIGTQVTVEDNLAPSLAVQNIEVSLDENGEASIATDDVEVSSSDNCAVASKALNIESFSCEDLGEPVTVEMTVADASGNETKESFTVTVVDEVAPTIPEELTIDLYLDENGVGLFDSGPFLAEASDNCGLDAIVAEDSEGEGGFTDVNGAPFNCNNLGTFMGPLYVRDQSGNMTEFTGELNVIDTIKPVISSEQSLTVQLDEDGLATVDAETAPLTASDNCSIASRSLSQTQFTCEDLGWNEVTFSVADASENQRQITIEVLVEDNVAPVIAESFNLDVYLDENGSAGFDSAPLLAEASDNCGLDAIAVRIETTYINAEEVFSFDCSSVGQMSETVYVTDASGNGTPFTLNLTVIDTIKPTFDLEVIEIEVDAEGNAVLTQEMLLPYATDNCGIAEVAIENSNFNCGESGDLNHTDVIVFDMNGNATQRSLWVTINDFIAPEVDVEDIIVELDEEGQASVSVDSLEMMIIENCSVSDMELSKIQYSCSELGENLNSVMVTDAGGNNVTDEFTVTVVDNIAPSISGPQVMTICEGAALDFSDITASDNCSANLETISGPQEGTIAETGEYTVEFQATDPSGNVTDHSLALIVIAKPEVDLGEDIQVELGEMITLSAGTGEEHQYLWSTGDTSSTITITAEEDMTVSVMVTTPEGCSSSDEITIEVINSLSTDEGQNENSVRFFPNPTSGQLNLELELAEPTNDLNLTVVDISGKVVHQEIVPIAEKGQVISMDFSSFAQGVYLINLKSDFLNLTERVVKQ